MANVKRICIVLASMVITSVCSGVSAKPEADEKPRIVVEWGFSTPDTAYLQRNTEECEKLPVDGIATWPCWPRLEIGRMYCKPLGKRFDESGRELPLYTTPSGKRVGDYQVGRRVMGYDKITDKMCKGAIRDLKATKFERFNHMLINVLMGNLSQPLN